MTKALFLKYTTTEGANLTVEEDSTGFYMTDESVGWDQVLFGEKVFVSRDDVRDYARNTVDAHPLPFELAFDADNRGTSDKQVAA